MSQPAFFPIISSTVLAKRMAKELPGKIDAFVIENSTAGGHNAPPRNKSVFNERGEPVYGHKDEVDLLAIKALGIPYVRAGGYSNPERARQALRDGAAAIQAGTIFQYSEDSGLGSKHSLHRSGHGFSREDGYIYFQNFSDWVSVHIALT